MSNDSPGLSLKLVASLSMGLIVFLLWGGAAAIYKTQQDQVAAAEREKAQQAGQEAGEDEDVETVRLRVHRGSGLVAAVVVMVMGIVTFLGNSFSQLAHLPSVILLILTERKGYLAFCLVVLAASVLTFVWMGNVQKSLASGSPFKTDRKKKKLPKIRTPKPTDL